MKDKNEIRLLIESFDKIDEAGAGSGMKLWADEDVAIMFLTNNIDGIYDIYDEYGDDADLDLPLEKAGFIRIDYDLIETLDVENLPVEDIAVDNMVVSVYTLTDAQAQTLVAHGAVISNG